MQEPRSLAPTAYRSQIRSLVQAALAIFVFTVVIGILNGTDIVDFGHQTLLTHVHTGTLGWITLSVFAAALWLFGRADRPAPMMSWLPGATVVAVVAYNVAFFTTSGEARPTVGGFMLLAIVGWLVWIYGSARGAVLSVPRLGVLAAVTTAAIGGLLGVLLGVMLATGNDILPGDAYGSHPATMVIGFLVPVGMALAEARLRPDLIDVPATASGKAQIALPFIGGLCVTIGLLADSQPLVALSLPFEVIGVGIFIKRMWSAFTAARTEPGAGRLLASATPFWLGLNIFMFIYLIGRYQGDFDNVPTGLILALDHMMFIGVMSNALFAQAQAAAAPVKDAAVKVLFWGMNIGLAGFVLGLIFEVAILKRIFTPIMGLAILHGVALFTKALWEPPEEPSAQPARVPA